MRPSALVASLLLLCLAACGGSGGSPALPVTVTLTSLGADDGTVGSGGSASPPGALDAGDDTGDIAYRGIARFDVSAIPVGSTVLAATLRTNQYEVQGAPYAFGPLVVDHVVLGTAPLAGTFFAAPAERRVPGSLSVDATLGTKSLDVAASLQNDFDNGRTRSDYRLKFDVTDADGVQDLCLMASGDYDGGTGEYCTLEVTYLP